LRNWLRKHGKEKYIDFDDAERRQYRDIFKALDGDGSGAIGVEELEDP
jgi:centrin-2